MGDGVLSVYQVSDHCSMLRAEISAIVKAFEYFGNEFSDSQTAIKTRGKLPNRTRLAQICSEERDIL